MGVDAMVVKVPSALRGAYTGDGLSSALVPPPAAVGPSSSSFSSVHVCCWLDGLLGMQYEGNDGPPPGTVEPDGRPKLNDCREKDRLSASACPPDEASCCG